MKTISTYYYCICCFLALLSSCSNESNAPLSFYDSTYEVRMGHTRMLGLKSGNGDYSLEIQDQNIAAAGTEYGWTGTPKGCLIYINGLLTGKTTLKVTDNATGENCLLPIKVVDNYEDINLCCRNNQEESDQEPLFNGIDDIFLMDNFERDAYFFRQGEQTALSSGLELVTKGTYELTQETAEKATLTLLFSEADGAPATAHTLTLWGTQDLLHRLNKNLSLNWQTSPSSSASTRTSPEPLPSYTLQETTAQGETGRTISFILNYKEIPFGILP